MITIKNKIALQKMAKAGSLLSEIFIEIASIIKPGISTADIDAWINKQLKLRGLVSKTQGYMGYKHVSCISINDEVVHGVPDAQKVLQDGDLLKIDVCASYKGYCADMARMFFVGTPGQELEKFIRIAYSALDKGIEQARAGNRLSDISAAIQQEVEQHGYGIVRDFAGHGIGKEMHEDPEIVNFGKPGNGPLLQPGMTFAIEPMITMGHHDVHITQDGWTVKTNDKSLACHVEDTIVVTHDKPKILTRGIAQNAK